MKTATIFLILMIFTVSVLAFGGHMVTAIRGGGSVVILQNGTAWLIKPIDRYMVGSWVTSEVRISNNDDRDWPFLLTSGFGDSAAARPAGQ